MVAAAIAPALLTVDESLSVVLWFFKGVCSTSFNARLLLLSSSSSYSDSRKQLLLLFSPSRPAADAAEIAPLPLAAATVVDVLFASLRVLLLLVIALTGASMLLSESEASGVVPPPISPSPSSVVSVAVVCVVFSSIIGSCDVESFETKFESPSWGVGLVFSFSDSVTTLLPSMRPGILRRKL